MIGSGAAGFSMFQAPTTFQIRRGFFQYGGEMDVMKNGIPHFRCITFASPLGFGHSFNLTDMNGNPLVYIQPDADYGDPKFHIMTASGEHYATLRQGWSEYEKKFEVHNKFTGEDLKVHGDWFGQNFEFSRHHTGQQVARVIAGYGGDSYDVTIYPGEDALFILAATLTIEKLCHEHRNHHRHQW